MMTSADKLDIEGNNGYSSIFEDDEFILYSNKCHKINTLGRRQERTIVLTTKNIYNLKKKKMRRKISITNVGAIIMSSTNLEEFVLHIPSEYDYRYQVELRNEFVDLLQLRFANLDCKNTLKIYQVSENLKLYTTTLKNKKYGISKLPEDSYRLRELEIIGSQLLEEERELEARIERENKRLKDSWENEENGPWTISDDLDLVNSRRKSSKLEVDLVNDDLDFNSDDFNENKSTLIFSSSKYDTELTLDEFDIINILGRGAFGKVYLAKMKANNKLYAIKAIRKDVVIETDQIDAVNLERDVLLNWDHQFLVGMEFVFQSELRLYFVMPFVQGGELYKHFLSMKRFPEEVVKFYAFQIALAIGHLHSQNIVHRDLKLENILIDKDGYLKIIDFGLAKILKDNETTRTICGTPEYLAPEMFSDEGHDKNVDWWSFGVLIYEMLFGVTPFYDWKRRMMMKRIQKSRILFPSKTKYRIEYSDEVKDLICLLLNKSKEGRLGYTDDIDEILEHPWFKGVDVSHITSKRIIPPFIPIVSSEDDAKYFSHAKDSTSLADTYIPREKKDKIKEFSTQFDGFEQGKNTIKNKS